MKPFGIPTWMLLVAGMSAVLAIRYVIIPMLARGPWRRIARTLGSDLSGTEEEPQVRAAIRGRPILIEVVHPGRRSNTKLLTVVSAYARHLDDVALGVPAPAPKIDVWFTAWHEAESRADASRLPRPPLVGQPALTTTFPGVVLDADRLAKVANESAARLDAIEALVGRWRSTAESLDLRVRGAWLLEGEWRGGRLLVVGDVATGVTVFRAPLEERPAGEDRWSDAARHLESIVAPASVSAAGMEVTVVLDGLDPDAARWEAAVGLTLSLAERSAETPYR